jgi:hypothetical protein
LQWSHHIKKKEYFSMRLKCISCEVLARPLYLSAAYSPHMVDIEMIRYGLHQQSNNLRSRLQSSINDAEGKGYDAVVLAYGLCGKSTDGLHAMSIPLVLPRAHDCITIFLGSRKRYQAEFEHTPGTYWYVQDYIERDDGSGASLSIGANTAGDAEEVYKSYVEKYGQDNADYLMEVMGAWQSHYNRAAVIDLGVGDGSLVEERARADALRRGWNFEKLPGDLILVKNLLDGNWNDDFLVVKPGQTIKMTYDEEIIGCR